MSKSRGCKKGNIVFQTQTNLIFSYLTANNTKSEAENIVKLILDDIVSVASADSAYIIRKLLEKIVELSQEKVAKQKHTGKRVGKKTFHEWTSKYPWLIGKAG